MSCDGGCNYDTSACMGFCDNGVVDGAEACDPGATSALADDNLAGQTCQDFNFYLPGGLACSPACTFVTAGCSTRCGDGVLDAGEQCDSAGTASPSDDVFAGDCRGGCGRRVSQWRGGAGGGGRSVSAANGVANGGRGVGED